MRRSRFCQNGLQLANNFRLQSPVFANEGQQTSLRYHEKINLRNTVQNGLKRKPITEDDAGDVKPTAPPAETVGKRSNSALVDKAPLLCFVCQPGPTVQDFAQHWGLMGLNFQRNVDSKFVPHVLSPTMDNVTRRQRRTRQDE